MSSYKWKIQHNKIPQDIEEILVHFGFEKSPKGETRYEKMMNDWKEFRIEVNEFDLVITFNWQPRPTEIYLDYLIQSGVVIGQIMWAMENARDGAVMDDPDIN